MEMNFYALLVAALSTLVVGFIWYGPLFGKVWMRETNLTEEELKKTNMFKLFGLTFFFSLLLASIIQWLVIHQTGAYAAMGGPMKEAEALPSYHAFMADYGMTFRTFRHGALHGFMAGLFFAFPLVAINGMFERRTWKYIFIHAGYWTVCTTIMGAIICGWV